MRPPTIEFQQYRRYYQAITEIRKRPHTHLYATVAFTFLAISLFAWYAIRPTIQTILFLRREIADKTEVNRKMEEKIAALIEAQAVYAQVEPSLPILSEAIPPTPNAVDLMSQLGNLASISQATISSALTSDVAVNPVASESAQSQIDVPKPQEITLSFALSGGYENLKAFLDGIIDMRRTLTIDSINFAPNSTSVNGTSTGPLQLVVQLRGYYVPEQNNRK